MSTTPKEGRVPSGNSKPASIEENRVAAINPDRKDYSDNAQVYVMSSPRTSRAALPKRELGRTERGVINAGARLASGIMKHGTQLPLEAVFTPSRKVIYFGRGLELERDISDKRFSEDLASIIEEGTIQYIAVMLDNLFPVAFILYGRHEAPEFFAAVALDGGDTDGK